MNESALNLCESSHLILHMNMEADCCICNCVQIDIKSMPEHTMLFMKIIPKTGEKYIFCFVVLSDR